MQELFVIPDCRVVTVEPVGAAGLQVAAQVKHSHACCPSCQQPSQSVHSRYHRHPADLPNRGNAVHINLLVRRFYCRNPISPRRTFAEPVPELLSPRARRRARAGRRHLWWGSRRTTAASARHADQRRHRAAVGARPSSAGVRASTPQQPAECLRIENIPSKDVFSVGVRSRALCRMFSYEKTIACPPAQLV